MKAACELLKEKPNMRIADLAYAVGYNEPKYFSSCFKKDFGMLPSEYAEARTERDMSE
jgi:AraC-like DNA-binding protein